MRNRLAKVWLTSAEARLPKGALSAQTRRTGQFSRAHVLGKNLTALRRLHRLKQTTLGSLLGVHPYTYRAWELGKAAPSLFQLEQLSHFYGVSFFAWFEPIDVDQFKEDLEC